jgi:hypothetical protein
MDADEDTTRRDVPTTGDYMDMAMWLADEEVRKSLDEEGSAGASDDERKAAG